MRIDELQTFSDLTRFLESYTSWDDGFEYDPAGIFQFMAALIRNFKANSIDADLREINGYLNETEKDFLVALSKYARLPEDD